MSMGARIAIGVVALLGAVGFLILAQDTSGLPAGAYVFYGLAALCVVIAIACFFPKSHPITLRIIGTAICLTYIYYVADSFGTENLVRAIVGFFVWGLPSGYMAIMGQYPSWGKLSAGFNSKQNKGD